MSRFCVIGLMMVLFAASAWASEKIMGDSLVLAGETPGKLLAGKIDGDSVVVRSTYLPGGTVYEAGRDYRVDPARGTIARIPGSRIPDFSTNILFGKKDFDHGGFPGYGNGKFFVYVGYAIEQPLKLAEEQDVSALLPKTAAKLRDGQAVKIIAFGDSITAGGEASSVELQYPSRYAAWLKERHPRANITLENGATGGATTVSGLAALGEKVLTRSPDLVLVAFGMNDCNRFNVGGVNVRDFETNLTTIVNRIREKTGAEVIMLSAFPPHPDWHHSQHKMPEYAAATRRAAEQCRVTYAEVFSVWQKVLAHKDASSLLTNNINHPNDFGHWLYLVALQGLKF